MRPDAKWPLSTKCYYGPAASGEDLPGLSSAGAAKSLADRATHAAIGTLEGPARGECRRALILTHLPGPPQGPTTPDTAPAKPPESPQDSLARALMLILDQVRNLKEAEFKILAVLAGLFATDPAKGGRISGRDLAEAAGVARRNVQYATDSLAAKRLLSVIPGSGPKPPTFTLEFLKTETITGVIPTPLAEEKVAEIHKWVASKRRQYTASGVFSTPQTELFGAARGVGTTPQEGASGVGTTPVTQVGQGDACARVDSKTPDSNTIIDRVLAAKPKHFDSRELEQARRWVHGYQCASGDKYGASPERNRNPPDDLIMSQIITAAGSLSNVIGLIHTLGGRKEPPGDQYGWYVTMALNLIHGIQAKKLKQARAQLRIARKPSPPAIAGEQQLLGEASTAAALDADPEFRNELLRDLAERRRAKGASR